MLIDIHTPLIIPNRVPVDSRYGETINLNLLPIWRPNNCDLRAVCGALEQKLLPQNHPAHENDHANYRYYESIGGYTEGANAIFEMHNSACRLIEDQLSVIDGRLFHLTCLIAQLRENPDGYICIIPCYWWDRTLAIEKKAECRSRSRRGRWWRMRWRFVKGGGRAAMTGATAGPWGGARHLAWQNTLSWSKGGGSTSRL